jgi:hypothetical protein
MHTYYELCLQRDVRKEEPIISHILFQTLCEIRPIGPAYLGEMLANKGFIARDQ